MAYIPGPLPKHERVDPEIVGYVPLTVNFGDFSDVRERGRLNLNYHWNFGRQAYKCGAPDTCPWKSHIKPRPQ